MAVDPLLDFLFGVFSSVAQVWLICGEACFGLLLIAVISDRSVGTGFRNPGHDP